MHHTISNPLHRLDNCKRSFCLVVPAVLLVHRDVISTSFGELNNGNDDEKYDL